MWTIKRFTVFGSSHIKVWSVWYGWSQNRTNAIPNKRKKKKQQIQNEGTELKQLGLSRNRRKWPAPRIKEHFSVKCMRSHKFICLVSTECCVYILCIVVWESVHCRLLGRFRNRAITIAHWHHRHARIYNIYVFRNSYLLTKQVKVVKWRKRIRCASFVWPFISRLCAHFEKTFCVRVHYLQLQCIRRQLGYWEREKKRRCFVLGTHKFVYKSTR